MTKEEYIANAQQGSAKSQCLLAIAYQNGKEGFEQDYEKAVFWLEKSAHQDYSYAIYLLGVCYIDGKGVKKDEQKGLQYIKQAAEKGDEDAMHYLKMEKKSYPKMVDTDQDPYEKERHKKEIKQKNYKYFSKRFWYREVKINAMLIIVGLFLAGIALALFIVYASDKFSPIDEERYIHYFAFSAAIFAPMVLITGRYFVKIIHRIRRLKRRHRKY